MHESHQEEHSEEEEHQKQIYSDIISPGIMSLSIAGPVFTKILRIFVRIVFFLRKILRIRIFLFTKFLILGITFIVFLGMVLFLEFF